MKAVILAAGYATRLYPLTLDKPKALLQISDKPILEYILRKIEETQEINEIFVITNAKFYGLVDEWVNNNQEKFKVKIKIINDGSISNETRLGGVKDLLYCIEKVNIDDNILVLNSDNLFDFSLKGIIDFFKIKKGIVNGVYLVDNKEEAKVHGVVSLVDDRIVLFEEKPAKPKTNIISIGIYIFPRQNLLEIKKYAESGGNTDGPGFLIKYFSEISEVYGYLFKGRLFDIGNIETYNKIKENWDG